MINIKAKEKITKAKSRLLRDHPFYAHLIIPVPFVEDTTPGMRMATDMEYIYYHPDFVEENSVDEVAGVICHEGLHIGYHHGFRKGNREHGRWNRGCDYGINPIIIDSGLKLPANRLQDDMFKGWSAEKIYEYLKQNEPPQAPTCDWGGVIPPKNGRKRTEAEQAELEHKIKVRVAQAAAAAKAAGKLPGSLKGLIEAVGKPTVNWHDYVQSWVKGQKPDNYTWTRPNRSYLAVHRIYMPRMQLNGAGHGLLSIDTSGSVSDRELQTDVTEVTGVIELCAPDKLTIVQHDSRVHSVKEWEAGEDFRSLKVTGRGGTCIRPVFKAIAEMDEQPDWIIFFSDGEIVDWPPAEEWPEIPTLLAFTGKDTSPAGVNATYIPLRHPMEAV